MDKKDVSIIEVLSKNSNITYSALGRIVKLSKQAVSARFETMVNQGLIFSLTCINHSQLGKCAAFFMIKLTGMDHNCKKQISSLLLDKRIIQAAEVFYKYDLMLYVVYSNNEEYNELQVKIRKAFQTHVQLIDISFVERSYLFSFCQKNNMPTRSEFSYDVKKKDAPQKLTKHEKILLSIISSHKEKVNYSKICNVMNCSPNNVKYLLKKFEKSNIIVGHSLFIDYLKLGLKWNQVIFRIDLLDFDKIKAYLKCDHNVFHVILTLDKRIIVDVHYKNIADLRMMVNSFNRHFPQVHFLDTYELIRVYKFLTIDTDSEQKVASSTYSL